MKQIKIIIPIIIFLMLSTIAFSEEDPIFDNLFAYYKFDETSGTVIENSYNISENGTATNGMLGQRTGISGNALLQPDDDTGAYTATLATIHNHMNTLWSTSSFTMNIWLNRTSDGANDNELLEQHTNAQTGIHIRDSSTADNSLGVGFYQPAWGADVIQTGALNLGQWYMITMTWNNSNNKMKLYVDGSEIGVNNLDSSDTINTLAPRFLQNNAGRSSENIYDELAFFNVLLTDDNVTKLYNSGDGLFFDSAEAPLSSNIEILLINKSFINKSNYGEGEDFKVFLNLTYSNNNTPINNSVCNISLENGIIENEAINNNFTLCNAVGCDYDNYSQNFNLEESNGDIVVSDTIHFKGCHQDLSLSDIFIDVNCGTNSTTYVISPPQIPSCDSGTSLVLAEDTEKTCINYDSINLSIYTTNAGINKAKIIESLSIDREFFIHTNIYNEDVFYNNTNNLYYTVHNHEYYEHGSYYINATCINPTNTDLNINASTQITIVNTPPEIFLQTMNNSLGIFDLDNNSVYEYADGNWSWIGSIIDDDLKTFSVYWYNSSNDIIHSFIDIPSLNITQLDTPNRTFADFQNPYKLFVNATDFANATTTKEITFTVNDTTPPNLVITTPSNLFLNTTEHIRGTDFNFTINFLDEALYKTGLKIYLSNGTILYNNDNLFNPVTTSYQLKDAIANLNVTDNIIYGSVNASDGHTLINIYDRLKEKINKGLENEIVSQDFRIVFNDEIVKIDLEYTNDRVKQKIKFLNKLSYTSIDVFPLNNAHVEIIESDKYFNYLIINEFWSDYLSKDTSNVIINKVNGGEYYNVKVYFDKPVDTVDFESIGIINTVSKDFFFTLIEIEDITLSETNMSNFDLTKQSNVIILLSLILCMLGCYFLGFTFKNFGFISFGFFIGLIVGFLLFDVSWFVTGVFWLINASIFLASSKGKL